MAGCVQECSFLGVFFLRWDFQIITPTSVKHSILIEVVYPIEVKISGGRCKTIWLPSSRFLVNTHVKNSVFKFVFGSTNDFPMNASFPHNFIFLSNSCLVNYSRRELKSQFLTNSCQGNSHFPAINSQNACFRPRNFPDILCFPGGKRWELTNSPSGKYQFSPLRSTKFSTGLWP